MSRRRGQINPYLKALHQNKPKVDVKSHNVANMTVEQLVEETKERSSRRSEYVQLDRNERQILSQFAELSKTMEAHGANYANMKRLRNDLDAQLHNNNALVAKLKSLETQLTKTRSMLREREFELKKIRSFVSGSRGRNLNK